MPLYNAERYLSEAIESIQCQIFTEYELICINDASTDKTLEILEQFIQSEPRIIPSTSFNTSVYIAFADTIITCI